MDQKNKLINRKSPTKTMVHDGNLPVGTTKNEYSTDVDYFPPETLDSSDYDYCYEDEQSTVYSPLPSPKGPQIQATSLLAPLSSPRRLQLNCDHDDLDKASVVSSSIMDYSLTYEDSIGSRSGATSTPRYLPDSDCGSFKDLKKQYYTYFQSGEDKQEIMSKDKIHTDNRYIGDASNKPKNERTAVYIQELYQRVIAASNKSGQAKNNKIPSLEVMNHHEKLYANKKTKQNKDPLHDGSEDTSFRSFIPLWVIQSSPVIKMIIVLSTALLIGSLTLIVIALLVSLGPSGIDASQQSSFLDHTLAPSPSIVNVDFPTIRRPSSSNPTKQPSAFSTVASGQYSQPTAIPNLVPSVDFSLHPSVSSISKSTVMPTITSTSGSKIKPSSLSPTTINIGQFYVTSQNRQKSILFPLLSQLSKENDGWMINLGNWNVHNKEPGGCRNGLYNRVSNTYKNSTIPVFFIPGDNEWSDCDNYPNSVNTWRNTFVNFEMNWSPLPFDVYRQKRRLENFCFIHKKVLYFGLNMVSGQAGMKNNKLWSNRLKDNFNWVRNQVRRFVNDTEVVVMFGNSGSIDANKSFFLNIEALINQWKNENRTLPVFYIKESENESVIHQKYGLNMINIHGGIWPPAKISIDTELNHFTYNDEVWI